MENVLLSASYAFPPNAIGYCGKGSFTNVLKSFFDGKSDVVDLKKELEKFHAHYSYLKLIAESNKKTIFDEKVVKAFWLGNELLDGISLPVLKNFIKKVLFQGKQKKRSEMLCSMLEKNFVVQHSFNVLFISFVSLKVPKNIKNFDHCIISWAKVKKISGKKVFVRRFALTLDDKSKCFSVKERADCLDLERKGIRFIQNDSIKNGDWLSSHWGMAIQKLSNDDLMNLKKYTINNINAVNAIRKTIDVPH